MKESTYTLFEQLGLVFETHCPDQLFSLGEEAGGRRVGERAPDLVEVAVSLCFVLPALAGEPGTYNVISVSRASLKPDPLRVSQRSDLDLAATYDAANGCLTVRVAAGERSETCREIRLENLPPATVVGRVLRLLVILKQDGFYASLDSEDHKEEIAVHGDAPSCGSPLDPWGSSSAGLWRVTSGAASSDEPTLAFPPGFGLSDVQILLHGASPRGDRHLPYSGELDHLTGWGAKWAALRRTERLFPDELMEVAGEVRSLAVELEPWVRRTHLVADHAEALACRQIALDTDPDF